MCFSVWQPGWKAGGRGSGEEGKDSLHLGIGVKPAHPFPYEIQRKPALCSGDSHPFRSRELPGVSEKSHGLGGLNSPGSAVREGMAMASWLYPKVLGGKRQSEGMRIPLSEVGEPGFGPSPLNI